MSALDTTTYACTLSNGCPGEKIGLTGRCYCANVEGLGTTDCSGQCSGQAARMWCNTSCQPSFCQALSASQEVCDGCDNDRNGAVDNATGSSASNSMTTVGNATCSTSGTRTCVNGAWSAPSGCGGVAKCQSARCNYEDGTRPCDSACNLSGTCSATEQCDGCDNDADDEADEGLHCPQCNL